MTALDREPTFQPGDHVCFVNANNKLIRHCTVVALFACHVDGRTRVELIYTRDGETYKVSPHVERVAFEEGN